MTDPNNSFVTPVGRLVGGSVHTKHTKKRDDGSEDTPQFVVIIALPKSDPGTLPLIEKIRAAGQAGYASQPQQLKRNDFAWKFVDGDSTAVNQKGVAWNTKEGYTGHYVLTATTQWDITVCGDDPRVEIDAKTVERGFWIRVAGNIKGCNDSTQTPGVYLNLEHVQFVRSGEVIQGGRSAADAFGGGAPATQQAPAAPAHDIVDNVVAPPPPPPPSTSPSPPRAPGLQLTAKGLAESINPEAYIKTGWTEDQLRKAEWIV